MFPKKEGADGTSPRAKVTQPQTQEDNKDELMAPPLAATLAADATHQKEGNEGIFDGSPVQDLVADVEHHFSDLIDLAQHALDHAQIGHIRKGMKLVGAYWRNAEICAYWRRAERGNIKETQERPERP